MINKNIQELQEFLEKDICSILYGITENSCITVDYLRKILELLTPKAENGPSMTEILNKLLEFLQIIMQNMVEIRENQIQQSQHLVVLLEALRQKSSTNIMEKEDAEFSQDRS